MRNIPSLIQDLWNKGGPFIGENKAHGRVTVEIDWELNRTGQTWGSCIRGPYRWWQRADNSQIETEVPNIVNIQIDRSLDSDAGTCSIELHNQWMIKNDGTDVEVPVPGAVVKELGKPGYFTWNRGASGEARARWGHQANMWENVLRPNALLRTYQGWGGQAKTLGQALTDGNLVLTGVWLIDEVRINSKGTISLKCRDMAKLLIDQPLFPPLIPGQLYPLVYQRFKWTTETVTGRKIAGASGSGANKRTVYRTSSSDKWYGFNASIHGHRPSDCLDGNPNTFALSVGNSHPSKPFCADFWEFDVGETINGFHIAPWAGNYEMYVSIMENGAWVDAGLGQVPYSHTSLCATQRCISTGANEFFVMKTGLAWETPTDVRLPRTYNADRIRITFRNHTKSQWGPWYYRAGIRIFGTKFFDTPRAAINEDDTKAMYRSDGNYLDYSDIIKELLLWAGFLLYDPTVATTDDCQVYGNIESTGVYSEEILPQGMFDKKPVIDAITQIRQIVGFIFFVDDEGAVRFESPNFWEQGNFYDTGEHTEFIPEIDEKLVLTDYTAQFSDKAARSEIIISSNEPSQGNETTITTNYLPVHSRELLHGMVRPAMWVNGFFTNSAEQKIMAELVALHMWFAERQGQVSCVANPAIQINDQVRIFERQTAETYIHYVRGISTNMDLESGAYTMTLTTHWLGDQNQWAITKNED